ncbi:MAG: Crp/Fnr family transcriptional regulator [Chloroflexi bacterium]|jgi:CRP/FNR family cyclic AMP-dependent transcriptional regulator|nr:Crp/Fnr family transcriptional regulator [Chloroflexota bacterium]
MRAINVTLEEKIKALRKSAFFAELEEPVLTKLANGTRLRELEAGEIVCWQGDPCEGLYTIESGSVKLFRLSPRGRELIIKIYTEGASFNEVPVFDHGTNVINVATLERSRIWLVEAGTIRQVMAEHPELAVAVIVKLSHRQRMLLEKIEELSFYQVTNRLARLISQENSGEMQVTQGELAARLGTVREVVARSLRELERSGAIKVGRRQIQVINEELLREWVVQDPC